VGQLGDLMLARTVSFPSSSRAGTSLAAPSTSEWVRRGAAQRRTVKVTTRPGAGATALLPVLYTTSLSGSVSRSPAQSRLSSVSSLSSMRTTSTGAVLRETEATGVPLSSTITSSWCRATGAGAETAVRRSQLRLVFSQQLRLLKPQLRLLKPLRRQLQLQLRLLQLQLRLLKLQLRLVKLLRRRLQKPGLVM